MVAWRNTAALWGNHMADMHQRPLSAQVYPKLCKNTSFSVVTLGYYGSEQHLSFLTSQKQWRITQKVERVQCFEGFIFGSGARRHPLLCFVHHMFTTLMDFVLILRHRSPFMPQTRANEFLALSCFSRQQTTECSLRSACLQQINWMGWSTFHIVILFFQGMNFLLVNLRSYDQCRLLAI